MLLKQTENMLFRRKKLTIILSNELFIIAISMFKATITVQTTWAIIKMRPNVAVSKKAGSSTEIFSSSTRPSNSQNTPIKASLCLKGAIHNKFYSTQEFNLVKQSERKL